MCNLSCRYACIRASIPISVVLGLLIYFYYGLINHGFGPVVPELSVKPVVMWHGMGDTCCLPFSLGSVKKLIERNTNKTYVKSIEIGGNIIDDYKSGFFIHPDKQPGKQISDDPKLSNGYNAIGFSQGGQFLRAVAQRCPHPPMKVLISIGGQHQGIFGLSKCPSLKEKTCDYIRKILNHAAYDESIQNDLVQATYWHDPLQEENYRIRSTFLSDINNELDKDNNLQYANNLNKLEKFIMVMFANDTIVQPKESEWFSYYYTGQDREIVSVEHSRVYKRLGLDRMKKDGKLIFLESNGDHLMFSEEWFINNVITLLSR